MYTKISLLENVANNITMAIRDNICLTIKYL